MLDPYSEFYQSFILQVPKGNADKVGELIPGLLFELPSLKVRQLLFRQEALIHVLHVFLLDVALFNVKVVN